MRNRPKYFFTLATLLFFVMLANIKVHAQSLDADKYLCWAAGNGDVQQGQWFISMGANVNHFDEGVTALMGAAYRGHKEVVEILLNKGSNVNLKNEAGTTALMYAAMDGHSDIVRLLLGKNARVNDRDKFGQTALMQAAISGDIETIKVLVEAGADLNIKNAYGMTARTSAVQQG